MKKQMKNMVALLILACIMLSVVGCTRSAKLVQVDGKWHYYDAKGNEQHGFVEYKGNTYYITEDGTMNTGFWLNEEDEEYYYSDSDGVVQKNKFVDVDGKTYYLKADGKRQHGWAEIDGKTMYFHNKDNGGRMVKNGWIYDFPPHGGSKEKYFFADEDGNIVRNKILDVDEIWQTDKIERRKHLLTFGKVRKYFLNPDGEMQTGFVDFQGARYYFADDGQMRIGSFKVDGATYNTDENGRIIN